MYNPPEGEIVILVQHLVKELWNSSITWHVSYRTHMQIQLGP